MPALLVAGRLPRHSVLRLRGGGLARRGIAPKTRRFRRSCRRCWSRVVIASPARHSVLRLRGGGLARRGIAHEHAPSAESAVPARGTAAQLGREQNANVVEGAWRGSCARSRFGREAAAAQAPGEPMERGCARTSVREITGAWCRPGTDRAVRCDCELGLLAFVLLVEGCIASGNGRRDVRVLAWWMQSGST